MVAFCCCHFVRFLRTAGARWRRSSSIKPASPVVDALASDLARRVQAFAPDIIVGLPTLGLTLAAAVAQRLGHTRYVPLGNSAKFWYHTDLSVPISSVTTPDQQKRLFIDPRMLTLLRNRRVALIDDVISGGASMRAGLALLDLCGVQPVVLGTAMLQSENWKDNWRVGTSCPCCIRRS
jgi:adenine/guanine phosphoribosyltransferase-like PRPP-binding protein